MDKSMKNVLIIMPNFYSYAGAIQQEFENKGYNVDLFYEQPPVITYLTMRKIEKLTKSRFIYNCFLFDLYRKIKKTGRNYDYFLVIRGNILSKNFIKRVLANFLNKDAKTVYYTWDSFENLDHKGKLGDEFDNRFSFDSQDVENNVKWKLLPLFYTKYYDEDLLPKVAGIKYDLSCIAGFNEERYNILCKLQRINPTLTIKVCLYLSKDLYDMKVKIDPFYKTINKDWIIFEYLSPNEVSEINLRSKALLDITNAKQSGLSMRIIESIGLRRKIVTTNPHIKQYNFSNNALFINKESMFISEEWLNLKYSLKEEERRKYSLKEWINQLIF